MGELYVLQKMKPLRVTIITFMILGVVWFAFGKTQVERFRFYMFDQESWDKTNERDRYFMAKYLVDKGVLIGKTKLEVSRLLGDASHDSPGMLLYNLCPERGSIFIVDDDWLEITFDGTTDRLTVKNARIRPD